jgi:hypothetical protein
VDARDKEEAIKFQTKETGTLLSTQLQVKRLTYVVYHVIMDSEMNSGEEGRRQ